MLKVVNKKIGEIRPYVRNPRINDRAVDMLVENIPKIGFNVPIVVDKKGVIVKGHSRYYAAIKLGMTEIPCIVSENSDEINKLDRIADNRINEMSQWNDEALRYELDSLTLDFSSLDFGDFSFEPIDFDEPAEITTHHEVDPERYAEIITKESDFVRAERKLAEHTAPKKYYKVVCEECGHIMFVDANDVWEYKE